MTGPWWLSGQVSHCSFKVSPALTGMEFEVDFADLWQAMSDVPNAAGSTKPEESLARHYKKCDCLSNTVVLVQGEPAGSCWNLVGWEVEPVL
jgi:hypothetical protein